MSRIYDNKLRVNRTTISISYTTKIEDQCGCLFELPWLQIAMNNLAEIGSTDVVGEHGESLTVSPTYAAIGLSSNLRQSFIIYCSNHPYVL